MLQRLPVALPQSRAGNKSEILEKGIQQIAYAMY